MRLDITLTGNAAQLARDLRELVGSDVLRVALRDVALYGQRVIVKNFRSAGGGRAASGQAGAARLWPDVNWAWKLLRPGIAKSKPVASKAEAEEIKLQPLQALGTLRASFASAHIDVTDDTSTIGSAVPYAIHHQEGRTVPFQMSLNDIKARITANTAKSEFRYQMINYFKGRMGKPVKIQRRAIVPDDFPSTGDRNMIISIIRKHLDAEAQRRGWA